MHNHMFSYGGTLFVHHLPTVNSPAPKLYVYFCYTTYLSGQQVNDLKGMFNNGDGLHFLAVVATMHHEGVYKTLHHRTLYQHRVYSQLSQVTQAAHSLGTVEKRGSNLVIIPDHTFLACSIELNTTSFCMVDCM